MKNTRKKETKASSSKNKYLSRLKNEYKKTIEKFCQKWGVAEMSLFGSVATDRFGPESDIDVMVSFHPEAHPSLFDLIEMEEELRHIYGRDVDLIEKEGLRNPFRRHNILKTAEVIYAA